MASSPEAAAQQVPAASQQEPRNKVSGVKLLPLGKWKAYLQFMARPVDCQCPAFQAAVAVLGRPWTALILTLLQQGPRRFGEIAASAQGLGDKVLSARLKDLEARGLVLRHVEPGPPVRVSYELTRKGRSFGEVAQSVERWGQELTCEETPAKSAPRPARKTRA